MKQVKEILTSKSIRCSYAYFYVHFILEVVCFFYLLKFFDSPIVWLVPFLYDAFAFVPQGLIGYINDKNPKIKAGLIGIILLFIGIAIFCFTNTTKFLSLFFICFGNAFIHLSGAESTLRNSEGKLSHSAIFVSGGSFGVITGRLLSKTLIPSWVMLILVLSMIPFVLYADRFDFKDSNCVKFNYVKKNINAFLVIIIAVFVVIIRGYMGYGLPTSWNESVLDNILLFVFMGTGKALGGILSDCFGIRKIAVLSTILAVPFIIFGDNLMIISLIGIMLFSMTMSITLAILVSVLKKTPGLAFGLTTIGLFLGTMPVFFVKISNSANIIMIIVMSIVCSFLLGMILKDSDKNV